jgi:hypothetical protein
MGGPLDGAVPRVPERWRALRWPGGGMEWAFEPEGPGRGCGGRGLAQPRGGRQRPPWPARSSRRRRAVPWASRSRATQRAAPLSAPGLTLAPPLAPPAPCPQAAARAATRWTTRRTRARLRRAAPPSGTRAHSPGRTRSGPCRRGRAQRRAGAPEVPRRRLAAVGAPALTPGGGAPHGLRRRRRRRGAAPAYCCELPARPPPGTSWTTPTTAA